MSDHTGGGNRFDRLRRIVDESLSAEGVPERLAAELWELIEQLQTENEELQRSRDEVERLHRQFADLYELAPSGYLVLNERRTIIRANETARRFLGERAIDYECTALGPFLYAENQSDYFKALRESRESGEPRTAEICIEREDGYLWLQARIVADTDGAGTLRGYRITLTDITERVRAEQNAEERRLQVERLLDEKELLLREIHHRVKNDFHIVRSFFSLQGAKTESEEAKATLNEAKSRVTTMTHLYDILHKQKQYTEVDGAFLIEELIAGHEKTGHSTALRVHRDLEQMVVPTRLSLSLGLVLNELLANATKYAISDVEEPTLSVSLRSVGEDELDLTVADNGPGMPEDVLDRSALGFGLSIVDSLTTQHGGRLYLRNEGGAVVQVRMKSS
jgi:PAS domain S-box-containing protein